MVRGGVGSTLVGSCLLHVRENGGEGGGVVVEGLAECGTCVSDGEGDELP